MIKVHMSTGQVVEGTVFSCDPVTNTLVLKNAEGGGYSMLFSAQIKDIEGQIPAVLANDLPNLAMM